MTELLFILLLYLCLGVATTTGVRFMGIYNWFHAIIGFHNAYSDNCQTRACLQAGKKPLALGEYTLLTLFWPLIVISAIITKIIKISHNFFSIRL